MRTNKQTTKEEGVQRTNISFGQNVPGAGRERRKLGPLEKTGMIGEKERKVEGYL